MNTSTIIIGLDLGQQNDYTVLSVLEMDRTVLQSSGVIYNLIYLKRFPLKTTYPTLVNWVAWFIKKTFMNSGYLLVVDCTGVGRPIVDMLRENDLDLLSLTITGGTQCNWRKGKEVSVPKKELISSLQAVIQSYRIKIASDIDHLEALKKEFLNFKARITSSAKSQFSAESWCHDDIVLSISFATWYGEYASRKGRKLRIITG